MIRRRGYSMRGQKVAIRGDYQRKARVSILAFAGVNGIIDYYDTEGTFDRVTFVECCRRFAYSEQGKKSFQRHYVETSSTELTPFIARTFLGLPLSTCQRYSSTVGGPFKDTSLLFASSQKKTGYALQKTLNT
ncbi:hypothetical protein PHMEG_00030878 [Phytophthora megakarya]|uniref:Uncharacterized protein n=1 Tax=Phytophthora megakarya TaxID=4795 RepID=A0A225UZL8_9STRA|nr:hypothetical protein PHMEG_00030878 [Phytophthora megakarya]